MVDIQTVLNFLPHHNFLGKNDQNIKELISLDVENSRDDVLFWCNDKNLPKLQAIRAGSVIVGSTFNLSEAVSSCNYIIVDNPRRSFQLVLNEFFSVKEKTGIRSTAAIADNVHLGSNIFIGNNVVIDEGCSIGDNCRIGPNTVLYRNTKMGNNTSVGSNCTIGAAGFGYEQDEQGNYQVIEHIGNVVIGNSVEIGNNSCIDRAVLGSTTIFDNVKIDNLSHIAHGATLKNNCIITANVTIAGSVIIEKDSWVGPGTSILQSTKVGENSLIGIGSVVVRDVRKNCVVAGNPAKIIGDR